VILSTRRLAWVGDVDQLSGHIACGAGATLSEVRSAATAAGWEYGVDLAARDTATIGGTVATNAGGIRVLAYGMTRSQIVGIEAVLPDGTVLSHMQGLQKDNTGLDLGSLVCGSEGALAVITAVRLRLHRAPGRTTVALVGCDSYGDALDLVEMARESGFTLLGAECMDDTGMELVCDVTGLPYPLGSRYPIVTLLEVEDGGTGEGLIALQDKDAVVASESRDQERLWRYREAQADGFATLGVLHKLDISAPLASLARCADEISRLLHDSPLVMASGIFGHLGDGNLHVEFIGPDSTDMSVDHQVLKCVARYQGSISAEHGIGRAKAGFLELSRTPAEIEAMHAIKRAWDPRGILNPGVLFA
jgi:FAD/FMN-containing dehydrogenase